MPVVTFGAAGLRGNAGERGCVRPETWARTLRGGCVAGHQCRHARGQVCEAQDFIVGCMAPLVIDIRSAEDTRDVVHRAVQALAEGRLVALPTETVYGLAASALDERAVKRLLAVKNRPEGQPLTLAVKSADDALDYVPDLSLLGRRLARRCWPGPVTLVVDDRHPDSLIGQLAPSVRQGDCSERHRRIARSGPSNRDRRAANDGRSDCPDQRQP